MVTSEKIKNLEERLKIHRRNLDLNLRKAARYGFDIPNNVEQSIDNERHQIGYIKSILRDSGVEVEDHPDDDDSTMSNHQPTQSKHEPTNREPVETQKEDVPPNNKTSLIQSSSKEESNDFEDSIEWEELEFEGNLLIVTKPKVRITFHMPYAFEDAKCEVEFSSLELNRVKVYLNHTDILGYLMSGLDTSPDSGARRFINKTDKDLFKAQLGQIQIILQQAEALDLCACIDIVCGEYKKRIMEAENLLETGNFPLVREEDTQGMGVLLLSVRPELWKLMCKFKSEFDYFKGNGEWHIFDGNSDWIRINRFKGSAFRDHAIIYGKREGQHFSSNYVHLIHWVPKWLLDEINAIDGDWQNVVGTYGIWTATYTENWLLNKFIPTVHRYYCGNSKSDNDSVCGSPEILDVVTRALTSRTKEELEQVDQPDQLSTFIGDLHFWFYLSQLNVKSSTVVGFFEAFLELAEDIEPSTVDTDFIWRQLRSLSITPSKLRYIDEREISKWSYSDIPQYISHYISHLKQTDFVPYGDIESMLNVCRHIVIGKFARVNQSRLNALKKHMIPLWQEAEFGSRYVIPHRWNI